MTAPKRDHKGLALRLFKTVATPLDAAGYIAHPSYPGPGYDPHNRAHEAYFLSPPSGAHVAQVHLAYFPHGPSLHLTATQFGWPEPPEHYPTDAETFYEVTKDLPTRAMQFGGKRHWLGRFRSNFVLRFDKRTGALKREDALLEQLHAATLRMLDTLVDDGEALPPAAYTGPHAGPDYL